MRIVDIKYLKFNNASKLSKFFDPETTLCRFTIHFNKEHMEIENAFQSIFPELKQIFPNLADHECCHDLDLKSKSEHNIVEYGNYMDIPHLLEHLTIDILSTIYPDKRFSGSTCQYENAQNKFDIFINVKNAQVSLFAFHLAWSTISSIICKQALTRLFQKVVQIASFIINYKGNNIHRNKIVEQFNCSSPVIEQALLLLEEFSLISEYTEKQVLI